MSAHMHKVVVFLFLIAAVSAFPASKPHYSKPPCLSDEVEIDVKDYESGYTGKVCAPPCGDDGSCDKDKPPSSATPQCLLNEDGSGGKKYCALGCWVGCGNTALTCLSLGPPTDRKVCAYRHVANTTAPVEEPPQATPPCCKGRCQTSGEEKYWSIASGIFGKAHCGECCMDPSKYNLYHFFEKNLTKSTSDHPCETFGYSKYDNTVTHGFGPVSMTLDLYDKP